MNSKYIQDLNVNIWNHKTPRREQAVEVLDIGLGDESSVWLQKQRQQKQK